MQCVRTAILLLENLLGIRRRWWNESAPAALPAPVVRDWPATGYLARYDRFGEKDVTSPSGSASTNISLPAPRTVTLRDQRHVLVRPIRSTDRDALAAAFLRLSSRSQQARFGSAPSVLGGAALRHLIDTVDGVDHVAFAAFTQPEPGLLVGVARILRYPDDPQSLDVGMTVADDYQESGLGSAMAALLAQHRPRPARRVITEVMSGNHRAMSLLTAFGRPLRGQDGRIFIELDDNLTGGC